MPQIAVRCEYCDREFMVFPAKLLKYGSGKYCSSTCAARAQHDISIDSAYVPAQRRVICACEVCGEKFERTFSEIERGCGKWCSRKCRGFADTAAAMREWVCAYCGETFYSTREGCDINSGGQAFCSGECLRLARWLSWADDIFDPLCPDGAYIMGFLIADGHIGERAKISFSQKEPEILWRIAGRLQAEGCVREDKRGNFTLELSSKRAYDVLTKGYGIPVGNKSLTVRIPVVEKGYLPHLIRGMFDGDGSVRLCKGGVSAFLYYSGSAGLVQDFVDIMVQQVGLPHKDPRIVSAAARHVCKDGRAGVCYEVGWGGAVNKMAFARYIYGPGLDVYGSDLYLERKRERFMPLFEPWRDEAFLRRELVARRRPMQEVAAKYGVSHLSMGQFVRDLGISMDEERVCLWCGERFTASITLERTKVYCSRGCAQAAREVGREERICPVCGKEFSVRPRSMQKYCSKKCGRKGGGGSHGGHGRGSGKKIPAGVLEQREEYMRLISKLNQS